MKSFIHPLILFLIIPIVLSTCVGHYIYSSNLYAGWTIAMVAMILFFLVAGHAVTGRFLGFLIDERNVISLSRLQIVLWTILILSAYLVIVLAKISTGSGDPAAVDIDQHLWALMGISMTSAVASPLLLSTKKEKPADPAETTRTFDLLIREGDDEGQLATSGQIVLNKDISQAKWTDLITGEETSNAAHLDITRVQMLFFTFVAVITYFLAIEKAFALCLDATSKLIKTNVDSLVLPGLSPGLIAIIGISHAGYLIAKASPRSKTGDAPDAPADKSSFNKDEADIPAQG